MYPVHVIIFHALRSMCPESPARRKAVPPHIPHSTMERLVRQRSRAVSAPFRNTLCHNGLAKRAFRACERASLRLRKSLFRKPLWLKLLHKHVKTAVTKRPDIRRDEYLCNIRRMPSLFQKNSANERNESLLSNCRAQPVLYKNSASERNESLLSNCRAQPVL